MNKSQLLQELNFKAVRSSGAGGQHVNKVSTKIDLSFSVEDSNGLTNTEKERIHRKIGHRLTKEGILQMQCDESRSQHRNKDLAIARFLNLIEDALKVKKKRRKTKPSRSSIEKRLKHKKKNAQKKTNRGKPQID
ncbi:alternative ribosome rescue aminoacyl-tRNA hydrolase ArfB [Zobellia barbeyronii]|uniref:Aminoacyl-tRNA hydrolase n=1 Tax=Zobellia barbeyronii TaxID=2748009 RepID=A0ABS5W9Q4_9FLAO|nr:alternative ribosome rescue aminoacyl-tRNA hydrolase ArfB [Zobellia barbeyronii]MBT2160146.1 aminoacyl-tRNA hydrolase [Zobellia barbeyronii]